MATEVSIPTMASQSTETVQSSGTANPESPKRARRLEIGTGEGLLHLFVCGLKGAGKTALITRYCQNRFPKWYDPIDVSHHSVENISQHQCLFEFVELDGVDGLRQGVDACTDGFKAMDALVLVYDVGDRSTFTALPEIFREAKVLSGKADFPVAVVGNKDDMFQEVREVDAEEGTELAEAIGGIFGQCSAREADGVRDILQQTMKLTVSARLRLLEEKDLQSVREEEVRHKGQEQGETTSKRAKFRRSVSQKLISRLSFGSV